MSRVFAPKASVGLPAANDIPEFSPPEAEEVFISSSLKHKKFVFRSHTFHANSNGKKLMIKNSNILLKNSKELFSTNSMCPSKKDSFDRLLSCRQDQQFSDFSSKFNFLIIYYHPVFGCFYVKILSGPVQTVVHVLVTLMNRKNFWKTILKIRII